MSAFDDHVDFYETDIRQHRRYNPINKSALIAKCQCLLPPTTVKDKTILDLGACLGAAGQWALFHGATHYTGIEIESAFVTQARALLAHWDNKAIVIQSDIRTYLQAQADDSVDLVIAAGVLQTFIDPQSIIQHLCRIAKHQVMIEATLPPAIRKGVVSPHSYFLQFSTTSSNVPKAQQQRQGIGSNLSPPALDLLFELNGFAKATLDSQPPSSPNTTAYTRCLAGEKTPLRFFARYTNTHGLDKPQLLETCIKDKLGLLVDWDTLPATHTHQTSADCLRPTVVPWEFNAAVAERFDHIAHTHIPGYSQILDLSVKVIQTLKQDNPRIIDVGCATGETLKRLQQAGFHNLVGVDNSPAMLAKINLAGVTLRESDTFPMDLGPFDVAIANWTLHFIAEREAYLKSVLDSLTERGILILTDKTDTHEITRTLYHDFKRTQGVSDEEIQLKTDQIKGVLTPYPVAWYYNVFQRYGFNHVDILSAHYGFVTFLVQKQDPSTLGAP